MSNPVDVYFDYASPWAYIASERLEAVLPGIPCTLRPIYLRGLESFATGVPYGPAKLAYVTQDLVRCAAHEGVRLGAPHTFPVNGLYALRGALAARRLGALERYHAPVFQAVWRDGRDVSTRDAVAAIARELGLEAVAEGLDAPEVKAELRSETEAAVARGLFGVPTFFVGDEMFWGHDRMAYVARAWAREASLPADPHVR